MAQLKKIIFEWDNEDRRTFENPQGLSNKELSRARRLVTENMDYEADDETAKPKK